MSLFGATPPNNLEQVLGQQADTASAMAADKATQGRKRLVAQQAAGGRLMSGVSDYNLGDYDANSASAISDPYAGLAGALGQIPAESSLDQNRYNDSFDLAQMIGNLNRPSKLQEALGALKTAGNVAGTFAAFA